MENLSKEYIYLDGMWLKEGQLLKLAENAGSLAVAEHYLCAYLANAVMNGRREAIDALNRVRATYGAAQLPSPEGGSDGSSYRSGDKAADRARRMYGGMTAEQRQGLLREALQRLIDVHRPLFKSRNYWNGIFLVLKDRVDGTLRKSDFADCARGVTPADWPEELTIGDSTLSNFSHYVGCNDRSEAYYDMENNPWKDLCETFWSILEQQILTSDLRNE